MRRWLRSIADIRKDEYLPAGLMFVYGFLAMTSHYLVKPARNSIFVDRVGADGLPHVYLLTAVVVTLVMIAYSRYGDRLRGESLLQSTLLLLVGGLLLFWWWLRLDRSVLSSGAFYVWTKLYPLLLVSQFWLTANVLFSTRQAKRLFGPIGVGLILGAVAGGGLAGTAAREVGSENLLLLAAGTLVLCSAVIRLLGPRIRSAGEAEVRSGEDLSTDALEALRESSHLRTIAWILGFTAVASTLIDWQLNRAVELFLPGEDAMAAFWGKFFALQSVASLLIQLLFTAFVLRRFGLPVALLALPVGILVASLGVAAVPVLLTAAVAKGTDGALRYSLDQSTRELLYLPVPAAVKYRAKPVLDLAVQRGGTGAAGLLLLLAHNLLGLSIRAVALLTAALVAGWIYHSLRMRDEFRASIRRLIGIRNVSVDELIYQQLDAGTIEELRSALRVDAGEEEVLFALSLLAHDPPPRIAGELKELLQHPSERVRSRAVHLLYGVESTDVLPEVRSLLEDPSFDVRVEAIHYVCDFGTSDPSARMEGFLGDSDEGIRTAALGCLLRRGGQKQVRRALATVRELARDADADRRRLAARLLGEVEEPSGAAQELLTRLMQDEDRAVRHTAIRSAGETGAESLAPLLLDRLEDPSDRRPAMEALERFGREIQDALLERIGEIGTPPSVRARLPRLFVDAPTQRAVDGLLELLTELEDPLPRYEVLKTLNKLHRDRPDLTFGDRATRRLVDREVREAYRWAAVLGRLGPDEPVGGASGLLLRTVRQRRHEAAERAVRLLALRHPQEDLYVAFTALTATDRQSRERGYELLDTLLPVRSRAWIDPLLNPDESDETRARAASHRYDFSPPDPRQTLRQLAEGDDALLSLLARVDLGRIGADGRPLGREETERLLTETLLADRHLEPMKEMGIMEIVERADFLRRTEIFEETRTEDLAGIAALMGERHYEEGDVVYREGETGCGLCLVAEGLLEARRGGRALHRAGPGSTVGHLSMLGGYPVRYDVVAREESRVLTLARSDFLELLEERFRVTQGVLKYLTRTVRKLEKRGEEAEAAAG